MKINKESAKTILLEEDSTATADNIDAAWVARFNALYEAIPSGSSQTIIAALGTALLAKATELRVDVFALKVGKPNDKSNRRYSARALCKDVLAAYAPRLCIHLGVHGREPLNNQPFFGKLTMEEARQSSHDKTRVAMDLLMDCLRDLDAVETTEEARVALRSFIYTRRVDKLPLPPLEFDPDNLSREGLLSHIAHFVRDSSEHGKRAQSVVAGLLDAQNAPCHVRVTKVHDPDRHLPGDVVLLDSSEELWIAFEVRDKPISSTDLDHFVIKCKEHGVARATVVSCAQTNATPDEVDEAKRRASAAGVFLSLYNGWQPLVDDVLMWSHHPQQQILAHAASRILFRAAELEVSEDGLHLWAQAQEE